MRPSRLVLCATDLGEAADEALRQADAVCHLFDAGLLVVHALPDPLRGHPLLPSLQQRLYTELPALMAQALSAASERVARVTGRGSDAFQLEAETRAPAALILERAEAMGADLVVVGARNASAGNGAALGAVAEAVVRYAHCPVLVARPSPPSGHFLAATDFSDPALPAVAAAVELVRRRRGRLSVVHSLELPVMGAGPEVGGVGAPLPMPLSAADLGEIRRGSRERLEGVIARFGVEGDAVLTEGPPAPAIVELAERLPAETIVVGTAGRTGIKRMLLGSVAEAVVRSAPCSVLVVRLHA